jgi:hypothetical protein
MNYLSLLNKDLNLENSINFNDKFIYLNRECNLKHWNSHFDKKKNTINDFRQTSNRSFGLENFDKFRRKFHY